LSQSKQKGLVNFISKEQAEHAITTMHEKAFPGNENEQKILVSSYRELQKMNMGQPAF